MKTYKQHIQELGYEIADDIIKKEENPNWEVTFRKEKVISSLCIIYNKTQKRITDDLENAIQKYTRKIREEKENMR